MTLKKQLSNIKENWLLILAVIVIFVALQFTMSGGPSYSLNALTKGVAESGAYYGGTAGRSMVPMPDGSFAPQETQRKITKSASLSTEVERGTFSSAQDQLKNIISSSQSIILREDVSTQDSGRREYRQGSYQVQVDVKKYDAVLAQLKAIGTVKTFSENGEDVTGQYVNLQDSLAAEKARLTRYEQMYADATRVEDKIQLNDRIFNQEMQIRYLEDAIEHMDERIEYSSVYVTLSEKQSPYTDVVFVKFANLVRTLVDSINSLLSLLFTLAPWAIAIGIVWFVVKKIRH